MARLFIIDQSLKELGGHHFDYVRLIAQAAHQRDVETVVATHRHLKPDAEQELKRLGPVYPVFQETTYTWLSHLSGLNELVANNRKARRSLKRRPDPSRGRVYNLLARRARNSRIRLRGNLIRRFSEDCQSFFSQFDLDDSDHVFFTTISEIEFMGLAAFLGNSPDTLHPTWHTQFHFSMFSGRPEEFAAQSRQQRLLTGAFQSALSRAPYHDIRTYTTSTELADQYNRMGLLSFDPLPYPINPVLHAERRQAGERQTTAPLRLAVAGGVRREKGQKTQVHRLIQNIWDRHIATGNVQLDIQSGKRNAFTCKRVMKERAVDPELFRQRVRVLPHPLPQSDYVQMIQEADVGLFCYDSRRYYSRRAGILCEFLASGKPVIVPAGSWLARQIAGVTYQHIGSLIQDAQQVATCGVTDLKWQTSNAPLAERAISFDKAQHPFVCEWNLDETGLEQVAGMVVEFQWQWLDPQRFVSIELESRDAEQQCCGGDRQIVTVQSRSASRVFLKIPPHSRSGQLTFRNAYSNSSINLSDVKVRFLEFASGFEKGPPRSAVGVIAADALMMQDAVDEMVNHYDHYQRTAMEFSRRWALRHDPLATVEALIPREPENSRMAA